MQMRNSLFSNNSHTEKRRVWEKLRNKLIAFADMSLAKDGSVLTAITVRKEPLQTISNDSL